MRSKPMSTRFDDVARYEEGQRQQWDTVAAGWRKWWPTIETGAQDVSKRMLDLAKVEPGHRVLDVAARATTISSRTSIHSVPGESR
jgi:hypothetical protein